MSERELLALETLLFTYQKALVLFVKQKDHTSLEAVKTKRQAVAKQLVTLLRKKPQIFSVPFKRAYYLWERQLNLFGVVYPDKLPTRAKEELTLSVCLLNNGFIRQRHIESREFQLSTISQKRGWRKDGTGES